MSGAITTAIEIDIEEIMDGAPMYGECMERNARSSWMGALYCVANMQVGVSLSI